MSIVRFELKKEHLMLIKALVWNENIKYLFEMDTNESPFGGTNLVEDLGSIIYGKPDKPFNPMEDSILYTNEQVSNAIIFYEELPTALEIVTCVEKFQPGKYKRKFKNKIWKLEE
jgi:hypothetical protein